jgi:hypothetical protein
VAKGFWTGGSAQAMSDNSIENIIDECKRQEESCLYTSTSLFEWLKSLRKWKVGFVVIPIILGAIATWPLLSEQCTNGWVTGICALLAGLSPAIYKALDFDVSLDTLAKHAHSYKILQDKFRQAWRITALGEPEQFKKQFDELMSEMNLARSSSLTPPDRFFKAAQEKVKTKDYQFSVDEHKRS